MQNSGLWPGAVIYQIYPRSFYDSNGDGVGDLPGVAAKLDYVASLGVDAIWLSPFFRSPMRDFGYDVADHCAVDPVFGTLADFDRLLARAHALGLQVIIDLVCGPHLGPASLVPRQPRRAATARAPIGMSGRMPGPTARRPTTGSRSSAAPPGAGSRAGASTICTISCRASRRSICATRR